MGDAQFVREVAGLCGPVSKIVSLVSTWLIDAKMGSPDVF